MTQTPRWTEQQFEAEALKATALFRDERMGEDLVTYSTHFLEARRWVEDLLEISVDPSELREHAQELLTDPGTLTAARYLAGPPISKDDLETVAQVTVSAHALAHNSGTPETVVETLLAGIDRNRFIWLSEDRPPTEAERNAATLATAAMIAASLRATGRRNEGKTAQEQKVKDALIARGFTQVATRNIQRLGQAPRPGEFCGESMFGEKKADIVVGLWDNRVMPLECKVSNSSTNSVKRIGEASNKAVLWVRDLGQTQVVPGAMIAGVFKAKNLLAAQTKDLTIWWSHDLDTLANWIDSTRP